MHFNRLWIIYLQKIVVSLPYKNRYALPSCAVANIRKRFPNIEIEADYTGLKLLK